MNRVMEEMQRCLDVRLEVLAFGKWHRPEERAKLAAATTCLHALQAAYPASWSMLQRRLLPAHQRDDANDANNANGELEKQP